MDYSKLDGLIPAVIQDADSSEVLMVGFMNEQALAETERTGYATFFSRTRQKLWTKGETSGNRLAVVAIVADCDEDTVLVKVKRLGDGNVCHTGKRSCFFRVLKTNSNAKDAKKTKNDEARVTESRASGRRRAAGRRPAAPLRPLRP
jgi:phosphoribosyl-AMP cyclohydrolase